MKKKKSRENKIPVIPEKGQNLQCSYDFLKDKKGTEG